MESMGYGPSGPFHGGNTGSNPVGDANKINNLAMIRAAEGRLYVINTSYRFRYVTIRHGIRPARSHRLHYATPPPYPKDFIKPGATPTPQCERTKSIRVYPYITLVWHVARPTQTLWKQDTQHAFVKDGLSAGWFLRYFNLKV